MLKRVHQRPLPIAFSRCIRDSFCGEPNLSVCIGGAINIVISWYDVHVIRSATDFVSDFIEPGTSGCVLFRETPECNIACHKNRGYGPQSLHLLSSMLS